MADPRGYRMRKKDQGKNSKNTYMEKEPQKEAKQESRN